MQELIKYFEALEARLAAQEERIAALERVTAGIQPQLEEMMQNSNAIKEHLAKMQEILDEAMKAQSEPEVEVDLVYPEEEEATVELPVEEHVLSTESTEHTEVAEAPAVEPEPVVESEPQPEPVVEQPASEPAPVAEPVVESVVEQQPEVKPEPVAVEQPKPEAPRMPQQTSLFGTPVTDIRQAVSIGDRFLFQRELFAGNAEKLQQTLTELDKLHSFDEAVAFTDKFGWDKQSSTYELFINVLRRRFQ